MNRILLDPVASCHESHDAADGSAENSDFGGAKPIFHIPSDDSVFSHADDLKMVHRARFKEMLHPWSRAIQVILQSPRYFYADKQLLSHFDHRLSPLILDAR